MCTEFGNFFFFFIVDDYYVPKTMDTFSLPLCISSVQFMAVVGNFLIFSDSSTLVCAECAQCTHCHRSNGNVMRSKIIIVIFIVRESLHSLRMCVCVISIEKKIVILSLFRIHSFSFNAHFSFFFFFGRGSSAVIIFLFVLFSICRGLLVLL